MNCKHVEKHIADYLSGQVDSVIANLIERHLQTCEACREKYEKEKSVSEFLRQADTGGPTASITDDLLQKVRDIDRESHDTEMEYAVQKSGRRIKWLALIAVVLGFIAVGLLIIPFGSQLNQQSVGSESGPGFTWLGDVPIESPDPFSLDSLGRPTERRPPHTPAASGDRVIHTLDFDTLPDRDAVPEEKEREP